MPDRPTTDPTAAELDVEPMLDAMLHLPMG
jgi:hypothetical protein